MKFVYTTVITKLLNVAVSQELCFFDIHIYTASVVYGVAFHEIHEICVYDSDNEVVECCCESGIMFF